MEPRWLAGVCAWLGRRRGALGPCRLGPCGPVGPRAPGCAPAPSLRAAVARGSAVGDCRAF
eukprot:3831675-Alexandrium_andersonii.AAC.1